MQRQRYCTPETVLLITPAGATLVHKDGYLHIWLQRYRCKSSSVYLHTFCTLPYLIHGPGSVNTMMSTVFMPLMVFFEVKCLSPLYMGLEHTVNLKESNRFENCWWDTRGKWWLFILYFVTVQMRFSYFAFATNKLRFFFLSEKKKKSCYLCCEQSSHR